jgi:tRNA threonylcarbamoyl adenosine modification protein YjeE
MSALPVLHARHCASEAETALLARIVAAQLPFGACVTLHGTLGAGKTHFARAVVQALSGAAVEVISPTFTLMQEYPVRLASGAQAVCTHADLYRVEREEELMHLGLEEALERGILLLEWPKLAAALLPEERLEVHLHVEGEERRRVELRGGELWRRAW